MNKYSYLFAAKTLVAALLALYLALRLDLPRPYWAMMTVFIVSHPLIGATRSKALYRIAGTTLGVTMAVVVVPPLSSKPLLFSLVVALWCALCLFLSLLDRSPRSYAFMLAAYTMPLVALPSLANPGGIFDLALSRGEESIIGIVCASLVASLVFPQRVTPAMLDRVDTWLKDAALWAASSLDPKLGAAARPSATRRRLAQDVLAFDQLITHIRFDSASARSAHFATELRSRMSMMVSVQASVARTFNALRARPEGLPGDLDSLLLETLQWMKAGVGPTDTDALHPLRVTLETIQSQLAGRDVLAETACARLRSLVDLWRDCLVLRRMIAESSKAGHWQPAYRRWEVGVRAYHFDYGMMLYSTFCTALATFIACALWLYSGWADGATAALMTSVACCFFASQDEPAPMIVTFNTCLIASTVLSAVIEFLILPVATGFEVLAVLLAVPFFCVGLLISQPRFNLIGMLLGALSSSYIGVQSSFHPDLLNYINANLAGMVGVLAALVWVSLTRPFGKELALQRLRHTCWKDLALSAAGHNLHDYAQLTARMLDRLSLLMPRLSDSELDELDGFRELAVGMVVLDLQRAEHRLELTADQSVQQVLQGLAEYFDLCRHEDASVSVPVSLGQSIDLALGQTRLLPGRAARAARCALTELRLAMFPLAAPAVLEARDAG